MAAPRAAALIVAWCILAAATHSWLPRCWSAAPQSPPAPARSTLGRGLLTGWLASAALPAPPALAAPPVGGETVKLSNGQSFPKASFGLQVYDDATAQQLTEVALSLGFRNFFASVLARNQKGFARGFKAAGVPRSEIYLCGSVLSDSARGFDSAYQLTKKGCDENLKAFAEGDITYVDQIMLDYPGGDCDSIKGQWKAFEEMLAAGATKSLAVSNFSPKQLDCILSDPAATRPVVNQLPYFVGNHDPSAVAENAKRGVVVQAWSPLGGGRMPGRAKKAAAAIGEKYGKSFAQVALRWIVQTGATYSTQTKKKEHFAEDLNIFDFQLTQEEVDQLSAI